MQRESKYPKCMKREEKLAKYDGVKSGATKGE